MAPAAAAWMLQALQGEGQRVHHAQVFTPMEGVPERMGLPDMTSGKRRLHEGDAADGDSPIEGVKGQKGRPVIPCSLAECQANIAYIHLRGAGLFWSLPSSQPKEMSRT